MNNEYDEYDEYDSKDTWVDDIEHYKNTSPILEDIFDDVVSCVQTCECYDVDYILDWLRDDWGDVYTDDQIREALNSCQDLDDGMETLAAYEHAMSKDD